MRFCECVFVRAGVLLAINLLFLMIWGFAGIGKLQSGLPDYFQEKFGATFMGKFPGVAASFWMLTVAELIGFALALVALLRRDFMKDPLWLGRAIAWSLFVFLMLGFGQWLTNEFNGAFQQFCYFTGSLVALMFVKTTANETACSLGANRPSSKT
jgi:hypothetical protein